MNHMILLGVDGAVREFRTDAADDIIEDQLDLPRGAVAETASTYEPSQVLPRSAAQSLAVDHRGVSEAAG